VISGDPVAKRAVPETQTEPQRVAAAVERAIREELGGAVLGLRVEAGRFNVLLLGRCKTFYLKQRVQHVAMARCEGRQLINRIEVA
jgi:hypothetical protein